MVTPSSSRDLQEPDYLVCLLVKCIKFSGELHLNKAFCNHQQRLVNTTPGQMGILRSITFQELALFIKHRQLNKREIASLALLSEDLPCPSFFISDRLKFIRGGGGDHKVVAAYQKYLSYVTQSFNCPLFPYWTWAMGSEKSRTERSSLGQSPSFLPPW